MPESAVLVKEWTNPPADAFLASLEGQIVHVVVSGTVGPEPTSLGEFFRFARVVKIEPRPASGSSTVCQRCSRAVVRWQIAVEWEAGYSSPDGDLLCEHCICGVVTRGAEHIDFAPGDGARACDFC